MVAGLCGAGVQVNATSEDEERTTTLILACLPDMAGTEAALIDVGTDIELTNPHYTKPRSGRRRTEPKMLTLPRLCHPLYVVGTRRGTQFDNPCL